jgi:hypothetical protein
VRPTRSRSKPIDIISKLDGSGTVGAGASLTVVVTENPSEGAVVELGVRLKEMKLPREYGAITGAIGSDALPFSGSGSGLGGVIAATKYVGVPSALYELFAVWESPGDAEL